MSPRLFRARWDGDVFVPLSHMKVFMDQDLVIDEIYDIAATLPRSMSSHNHFFARIQELWGNLPEGMELEYPSPEHLRKKMLIRVGWADQRDFVMASSKGAVEIASLLTAMDEYSIIQVEGQVVRWWRAKSQSSSKQDRHEFQKTKQLVLDEIEKLIGIRSDAPDATVPDSDAPVHP